MSARIIEFPLIEKLPEANAKTDETTTIKQAKRNNVKKIDEIKIDEIKREEERANEMFPPNYLMLIA